jgi:hypothetical protein
MLMPARGYSASMKQGMKSVTVMRSMRIVNATRQSVIKKISTGKHGTGL